MPFTKDGWLEMVLGSPEVVRWPSVRNTYLDVPKPLGIVWHWTAGVGKTKQWAENLARSIQSYDKAKDTPASWHFLVSRDGRIHQSVPVNAGSWHVGKPGKIANRLFGNINRATIGIELENAGRVTMTNGIWHDSSGTPLPEGRAVERGSDGIDYDAFPEAQVKAAQRLLAELVAYLKCNRIDAALGHVDFDFPRKVDPGELWRGKHLPGMLDAVFGPA